MWYRPENTNIDRGDSRCQYCYSLVYITSHPINYLAIRYDVISTRGYQYWPRGYMPRSVLVFYTPRSILVFSGRYHITSTALVVNNCFIIWGKKYIFMISNLETNIHWKARASQRISRSMDCAKGISEPKTINIFLTHIIIYIFVVRKKCLHFPFNYSYVTSTLRKHAYLNILKILPLKKENFQIKNSDIFHISAQNIDCGTR